MVAQPGRIPAEISQLQIETYRTFHGRRSVIPDISGVKRIWPKSREDNIRSQKQTILPHPYGDRMFVCTLTPSRGSKYTQSSDHAARPIAIARNIRFLLSASGWSAISVVTATRCETEPRLNGKHSE
jgi:hypothetical protein